MRARASSGGFSALVLLLALGIVAALVFGVAPTVRKGLEEGAVVRAAVSLARCDRILEDRFATGDPAFRPCSIADFDRVLFDRKEAPLDWPPDTLFDTFDASSGFATIRIRVFGRERAVHASDVPRDRVF